MSHRFRPLALAAVCAAALLASFGAAPAGAGLLVESADCGTPSTDKVFSPWYDYANYFLAPDGGFEAGADGWDLAGGAAVVEGNSAFDLSGPGASSLRLPSGSSAVSPTVCVGLGEPAARFVVKKTGGTVLATLRVDVLVEDNLGLVKALPIGVTGGSSNWSPSPQMLIVANLLPLLPGDQTPVGFRFVPQGGTWQVDDFHVDPTRRP